MKFGRLSTATPSDGDGGRDFGRGVGWFYVRVGYPKNLCRPTFNLEEDPSSLKEALSSIDAYLWQEAVNDEMDFLESNRTRHLVDLRPRCKTIGCKKILKKKLKPDETEKNRKKVLTNYLDKTWMDLKDI